MSAPASSHRVEPPSKELLAFAQRRLRNECAYHGEERRQENRQSFVCSVVAQPLTDRFEPTGEAFSLVTQNITIKGFGLLSAKPVEHRWLRLNLAIAGEAVDVVVRVIWFHPHGPFYSLGCEVVARRASQRSPRTA